MLETYVLPERCYGTVTLDQFLSEDWKRKMKKPKYNYPHQPIWI